MAGACKPVILMSARRAAWLIFYFDGRSYEAGVIASIFQLPAWVAHMGYPGEYALPEFERPECIPRLYH
jgi:hypothetical protein